MIRTIHYIYITLLLLLLGAATPALAQTIKGNVYGGGELGKVAGNTSVTIASGSVTTGTSGGSNVFGGGYQAEVAGNTAIAINGGEAGNVYGGGEAADIVVGAESTGNTTITMTAGTVNHSVYGGGLGNTTQVATLATVTINGGTVTEDVYGGSGFGKVGATSVSINNGATVTRDVFGGGFGSTSPAYEADVNGNASVTINKGASISGNVYGGNNTNGSPKGTVTVLVDGPVDGSEPVLSLQDVFGGGKNAATLSSAAPAVTIQGCATEVERVFGGGDAASVPATNVIIKGGHIGQAFAGGNGEVVAAHVGYAANGTTPAAGTGNANMSIQGGVVDDAFGGSNTAGNIRGTVEVEVDKADDACDLAITNLFGGGNKANGKAATIAIACTGNGKIENVFGGANQADVEGDITLNITGGNIGNIFGGNNQSGTINGAIAVNINWGSDECGIKHIDNVYGGGNLAPYTTPLGKAHPTITLTNGTVSNNVFGGGLGATAVMTGNPVVNINGGAVGGSVYGGGEQADLVGSTYVTINDGRLGADIFGGGQGLLDSDGNVQESADVSGTTHVTINGGEFAVAYDGLNFKEHYNIYGGGNIASQVGETHVYVTKGMVSNASDGSTKFLDNSRFDRNEAGMAQAYYHEGQMYFCIFGGGYGKNTSVVGDTWVDFNIDGMTDINSTAIEDDLLEYQSYLDVIGGGFNGIIGGNTNVHVGGNAMCRNVYGGGLYATIGSKGRGGSGETHVYVTGGNVDNVYGGGVMGDIMTSTNVNIGLTANMTFDGHDHAKANDKVTILMSVYGANDVSGHVPTANITHSGGTIDQNIYGAGNGDYRGYYTPGVCDYAEGENDNYFPVDHSGDTSKDGKGTKGPKGDTYKGRPQTDNVNITIGGTGSGDDRAIVLGQVFGGGNSCTVGKWHTEWVEAGGKYAGNEHSARDDKDYFKGDGSINITLNSHVKIGYDNTTLAGASDEVKEMYTRNGENVSGLFMGCSGDVLATQSTAEDDYDYHHYYDSYTAKYWPGFAVYDDSGSSLLTRAEGLKSFNAYLNNILIWTDNVTLTIANDAEDIWLSNFVGGGFRGSMKAKTAEKKFSYTLPSGVTIGNAVVGGAYNTDVVYRIYSTSDGHTYTEADGHYQYLTTIGELTKYDKDTNPDGDYHHIEYEEDGETIKGIVRFNYEGGIISSDGESINTDIVGLDLGCKFDTSPETYVYGGCFTSGSIYGNTKIDYHATNADKVFGGGYGVEAIVKGNTTVNVTEGATTSYVFGGGAEAKVNKNTQVNIIGGSVSTEVYGGGALANVEGNTEVNLTGGSIGSAYGGGLGDATTSALVYGNATVTLGNAEGTTASKVNGSIFGANNVNGTPLGHVKVHVLKTTPRDGQELGTRNTAGQEDTFDVPAVYGGGNKAAYVPTGSYNTDGCLTDTTKYAEVLIENCDNSIAYVYGGGNAAPVPATKVTIYGANAIDYAFAGGNGKGDGNKGADIGYLGFFSETREETPTYGYGETDIKIYGGTINYVYGGSNTLGYIREHASVEVLNVPDDDLVHNCELHLGDVHAGGNQAEMYCGGSVTLSCSEGAGVVYAGANEADIHGDIDLTITSGTYGKVFGGNNQRGNVYGGIKINIDETGCWPVMIGELYACGNEAPYSVYGYDGDGNVLTEGEPQYDDPVINLFSFTRIGKVFGGGYDADVYGSPTINVEPIPGIFAEGTSNPKYILNPSDERVVNTGNQTIAAALGTDKIGSIGTIYGGGNKGAVYGNTNVLIGTKTTNQHISGADKTTEHDVAVTITGDVFGGGNEAIVSGDTNVKIGEDPLNLP